MASLYQPLRVIGWSEERIEKWRSNPQAFCAPLTPSQCNDDTLSRAIDLIVQLKDDPIMSPIMEEKGENMSNEKQFTLKEYQKELNNLRDSLVSAPQLIRFLEKNHPEGMFRILMPMGLIKENVSPGEIAYLDLQPWVTMKPSYMVLSDESAVNFNCCGYLLGNVDTRAGSEEIPLDSMGISYLASGDAKRLNEIQDWSNDIVVTPENKITIRVKNTDKIKRTFRGILWCKGEKYRAY